jgi:hypothetical protein
MRKEAHLAQAWFRVVSMWGKLLRRREYKHYDKEKAA